jgi:hypothetical protein
MKLTTLALATLAVIAAPAFAHSHPDAAGAAPKGFETMKGLVGTWEGTANMEGKDVPVKTVFEQTSGGSVIMEKMAPGTEHEMINVYHKEGDRLAMTHYCAMGNQPHMMLKKGDDKMLSFVMEKPLGISSMKEPHMHAVTYTMADKDTLVAEWTSVGSGKKNETAVFKYKRTK